MKEKFDYFELLITPLKYKKAIILINFIVLILAVVVLIVSKILPPEISFLPNIYTSEAKILIPVKENQNINVRDFGELVNPTEFTVNKGLNESQIIINILKSNTVVDGIVNDCLLKNNPNLKKAKEQNLIAKEDLRGMILGKSRFVEDSSTGFIYIRYSDINPDHARQMVEAFLTNLSEATRNFALTKTAMQKRFIEDRLKELQNKLEIAKQEYLNFQYKYGIISPELEAQQITKTISDLRKELMEKEAELDKYRRIHNTSSPDKTELEYEVNNLRRKIISLTVGSTKKSSSKNEIIFSKGRISELSLEFANLKHNVENLEYLYSSLLNELEITLLQEKSEGPVIQVIDPPESPTKRSGPSRSKILIRVMLLSLFITIIIPLFIKALNIYINLNPNIKYKFEIFMSYLFTKKGKKRKRTEKEIF